MPAENGPMATGLVVPLVRIGQHFQSTQARHVVDAIAWKEMKPIDKEPIIREVMDGVPSPWARIVTYTERVDIEDVIHDAIMLWLSPCQKILEGMNRKRAPESVMNFYMLVLRMLDGDVLVRHPPDMWRYSEYHWALLNSYFREAVLEIDENLLEIQADWGESNT